MYIPIEFKPENLTWGLSKDNEIIVKFKQPEERYFTIPLTESLNKIVEDKTQKEKADVRAILDKKEQEILLLKKELEKTKEQNISLQDYANQFKDYLISDHLHSDMGMFDKESLKNILYLVELRKKDKRLQEKQNEEKLNKQSSETKREIPKDFISYKESYECLCGNQKVRGSKGCSDCRLKADAIRKRDGIPMEEAWREVWNSYGFYPAGND